MSSTAAACVLLAFKAFVLHISVLNASQTNAPIINSAQSPLFIFWKAKTSFLLTISIRLSLEMKACLMMYGYVICHKYKPWKHKPGQSYGCPLSVAVELEGGQSVVDPGAAVSGRAADYGQIGILKVGGTHLD